MSQQPRQYISLRERAATRLGIVERRDRPPTLVVMIATTPRTGSTLLGRTLGETGLVGRPAEHLLPNAMADRRRRWGVPRVPLTRLPRYVLEHRRRDHTEHEHAPFTESSLRRYLLVAGRREQDQSGVFALKTHWTDFHLTMESRGTSPDLWGAPVVWLRTRRIDRLAQAVSLVRAQQTGQWTHVLRVRGEPRYDRDAIRQALRRVEHEESSWDRYFSEHGVSPLEVVYEQLVADHRGTVTAVLEHLGHTGVEVPPPPIERQADDLNREWAERFRREEGLQ